MSVKVLIADDHEVVRHGLASLLSGSEVKIVAEAKNGQEVISLAKKHRPNVVLLDIRMPGADGLETLERLRSDLPNVRVVMLTGYDNPTYVARTVALRRQRLRAQGRVETGVDGGDHGRGRRRNLHAIRRAAKGRRRDGRAAGR